MVMDLPELLLRAPRRFLSQAEPLNTTDNFDAPEEEHEEDANVGTIFNLTLIACLLLAYYVKKYKCYYLPESAGAMILGMIIGGIARLVTKTDEDLVFFEFVRIFYSQMLLPWIYSMTVLTTRYLFFSRQNSFSLCSYHPLFLVRHISSAGPSLLFIHSHMHNY